MTSVELMAIVNSLNVRVAVCRFMKLLACPIKDVFAPTTAEGIHSFSALGKFEVTF